MALIWIIIKLSLKNVWSHKLRSFLTMLGINIGISSVIAMLALANGAKQSVIQTIQSMGTNTLVLIPGFREERGVASENFQRLTLEDCKAVLDEVPEIQAVSPQVTMGVQVKSGNRNSSTRVQGVASPYLDMRNYKLEAGRIFSRAEEEHEHKVAILGHKLVTDLFDDNAHAAVGNEIKINGAAYTVIGALKEKGAQAFFNPDDLIMIPYTTAMKRILGTPYVPEMSIKVVDEKSLESAIRGITKVMRKRHRLTPEKPDDFFIFSSKDALQMFEAMGVVFGVLVGGIASISLLVGGIGIMNIMLVTVTERTREIGIRKALGAKRRDIMRQFLIESLVISVLGGLMGVAIGIGIAELVNFTGALTATVSVASVLLSLSFCFAIGLFFGLYPAFKASRLDPIEALRYE